MYRMNGPEDSIKEAAYPSLNRDYFRETNKVITGNYDNGELWAYEMYSFGYYSIHDLRVKNDITLKKLEEYLST